jgi:hypothetical protein
MNNDFSQFLFDMKPSEYEDYWSTNKGLDMGEVLSKNKICRRCVIAHFLRGESLCSDCFIEETEDRIKINLK